MKGKEYFQPGKTYINRRTKKTVKCTKADEDKAQFKSMTAKRYDPNVHGFSLYYPQCQNYEQVEIGEPIKLESFEIPESLTPGEYCSF